MPRPINSTLRGWLGLLDAKVRGQAPAEFEEAIRGVVDAFPHLYAEKRSVLQAASGGLTSAGEGFQPETGGAGVLTVPAGELWLVEHHTVWAARALTAGELLQMVPAYEALRSGVGATAPFLVGQSDTEFITTRVPACGNKFRYVALPGDRLGIFVYSITITGTIDINISVTLVRCTI